MSKVFVDTNVIIFALDNTSPKNKAATLLLSKLLKKNNSLLVSPYILNEVHYIYQKGGNGVLARERILSIFTELHTELVDILLKEKNIEEICNLCVRYHIKTSDAFHAYYCKKLNIKNIATFDSDFSRIGGLTVLS